MRGSRHLLAWVLELIVENPKVVAVFIVALLIVGVIKVLYLWSTKKLSFKDILLGFLRFLRGLGYFILIIAFVFLILFLIGKGCVALNI